MENVFRRAQLLTPAACLAYLVVAGLFAALIALRLGMTIGRPNLVAALVFASCAVALVSFRAALMRSPWFASPAPEPVDPGMRHMAWIAALVATLWVVFTLPAIYRATGSIREVMVFWHDEGITLEQIYRFVKTPGAVPDYRLLQGWLTFLPVALVSKGINAFVPVEVGTINLLLRHYHLAVCWGFVFCGGMLAYFVTRSAVLSVVIVAVAFWRHDMYLLLAVDRPDGFQLLFVLLSLIALISFVRRSDAGSFFLALLFAALAFAAKFSGHLLLPAIAAGWLWHRRTRPGAHSVRGIAADLVILGVCAGVIFTLAFFLASPYHLHNFWALVAQIQQFLPIYASGNIYNEPNFSPPPNAVLWWQMVAGRGALDWWMLVLCAVGAALCLVLALRNMRRGVLRPEGLLLVWFATYVLFLVPAYGGNLVEYRYVFPVLLLIPLFALYPAAALLQRWQGTLPRAALVAGVCVVLAVPVARQAKGGFAYLAHFRVTEGARFELGRFLDRRVAEGTSPSVLMTNLAYIPDRITRLTIANVSVTLPMIEKQKFDYVITSDNMYQIYAGKSTSPASNQYYPGYDVYYNDVVAAYTAFKNRAHPDYRFLKAFDGWELFERVH